MEESNTYSDPRGKADVEQLLRSGKTIRLQPQGFSMYPMLYPGRDSVTIKPPGEKKPRRADVVLYRDNHGRLVLHRLVRWDAGGFYTVGDNQSDVEGPFQEERLIGILQSFQRRGREIRTTNPLYRAAARLWLKLLPVREPIKQRLAAIKKCLK